MRVKSGGRVRLPESASGHLDHLDVVGLKAFVDRANAGHAGGCHGRFAGGSPKAEKSHQQCPQEPWPTFKTGLVDRAHARSAFAPIGSSRNVLRPIIRPGCGGRKWIVAWFRAYRSAHCNYRSAARPSTSCQVVLCRSARPEDSRAELRRLPARDCVACLEHTATQKRSQERPRTEQSFF